MGIRNRKHIIDYGEVFTPKREMKEMINLVKSEINRIDSRFLEPACGDGRFLVEVLRQKIRICRKRYMRSDHHKHFSGFSCLANLYGIDIQPKNVQTAREALLGTIINFSSYFAQPKILPSIKHVLQKNIIIADPIQKKGDKVLKPIVMSEWSPIGSTLIQRRDFLFFRLVNYNQTKFKSDASEQKNDIGGAQLTRSYLARRIEDLILDD